MLEREIHGSIAIPANLSQVPLAGATFNDLHEFNPSTTTWTTLSVDIPLSARPGHGFTSWEGKLYVYGGMSRAVSEYLMLRFRRVWFVVFEDLVFFIS